MKIAMLTDLFYPYQLGGAERQFYELAKRLAKKHDVHVFTMNIEGSPSFEIKNGIKIHRFGINHGMKKRSTISLLSYFLSFRKISRELRSFDIIHANQVAGIFSFVNFKRKPFILTIHDLYLNEWSKYFSFPLYYIGWILEMAMVKGRYDRIITISSQSRRKIESVGMKTHLTVLHNGIYLDFIKKVRATKQDKVVYAGRLVKYKNVDVIIKAMKKVQEILPKTELVIIGSGEERKNLENLANELGVKARFLGYVTELEKIKQIKSAKVFASMSSVEGFGIVLLEAMAAGTPVVVRNLKCYKEFCTKNNSIMVSNNPEKAILKILTNTSLRQRLERNGRKTSEGFDWQKVSDKLEEIYASSVK